MKNIKVELGKIWKLLTQRIRDKYRLVILNDETFEERLSFSLSRMNVFIAIGVLSILLVLITTYIIAFTPLKEYIPGYTDVTLQRRIYELKLRSDSMAIAMQAQEKYLNNIRMVLGGTVPVSPDKPKTDSVTAAKYGNLQDSHSKDDSLLRADYDNQTKYILFKSEKPAATTSGGSMHNLTFFSPLKGTVTSDFNPLRKHFGVDVVAGESESIKSVQEGTVIFSGWTVETGNVIAVQHPGNVISVYKHNAVLLKKMGDVVKAGESIAIIGNSGEITTGPHMHIELWINGMPVNPKDYIVF